MSHCAALTLAGVRVGGAARAGAAGAATAVAVAVAVATTKGAVCGLLLVTAVMACVGAALGPAATSTGGT